jgi:hypothetical protein
MAPPAWEQVLDLSVLYPALNSSAITDIRRRRCRHNRRRRPVRRRPHRRRERCRLRRRVRHHRSGHRERCRLRRRVRHHRSGHRGRRRLRCPVLWMAPRWRTEWSSASWYCLALCCHHRRIQPLGRAWLPRRKARRQFWLRISSDSPLSTRATFIQSTCPYPGMLHCKRDRSPRMGACRRSIWRVV